MVLATRAGSWMSLTKDGGVRRMCSFVQKKRFIIAMSTCKKVSEAAHAHQCVGMLKPKYLLFQRQRLPVHRFRRLVFALALQHERQVAHARQRLGMLKPKHLLFQRQRLPAHQFRRLVFALPL
jgi:hypothetical protein